MMYGLVSEKMRVFSLVGGETPIQLGLTVDPVTIQCDATSVKGFITYIVRRHDGSRRRAPCTIVTSSTFLFRFVAHSVFPRSHRNIVITNSCLLPSNERFASQDALIAALFEFVITHWPVMTKDPNLVEGDSQEPLSHVAGSSDAQVALEIGLGSGNTEDYPIPTQDESIPDPNPILSLGGSSIEDAKTAFEHLGDPILPPIMAPVVEPPHDSQVLEDTLVIGDTQIQDDYPDPLLTPPKAMQAELPEATVPGTEGGQASGSLSASESVATTELEPSPSPLPAHTSEKHPKDVIEILESPNKKELQFANESKRWDDTEEESREREQS